nr:MAG TPA: hypothetical protein [Caudoviricetes sp.]DAV19036.1 MAG TPA: hypothetical protein [Caudoviricetes sp.]
MISFSFAIVTSHRRGGVRSFPARARHDVVFHSPTWLRPLDPSANRQVHLARCPARGSQEKNLFHKFLLFTPFPGGNAGTPSVGSHGEDVSECQYHGVVLYRLREDQRGGGCYAERQG